jgi:hypothetical protein
LIVGTPYGERPQKVFHERFSSKARSKDHWTNWCLRRLADRIVFFPTDGFSQPGCGDYWGF